MLIVEQIVTPVYQDPEFKRGFGVSVGNSASIAIGPLNQSWPIKDHCLGNGKNYQSTCP